MIRLLSAIFVFPALLGLPVQATADDSVYVQVRSAVVRQKPQHWAPSVATVSYGDRLTVKGGDDGWVKVGGKASGFIHGSALTEKRVVLSKGRSTDTDLDSDEVILAGKGFSKDVEREHASRNPGLNFAAVDAMEKITTSPSAVRSFMDQGQLG